jgi:menaquinol-cytochrome c reductase iron-sulfur subunit
MPDSDSHQTGQAKDHEVDKGRRSLLLLLPLTIFSGLAATIVTAAYRFLRPTKPLQQEHWNDVASLAELKGDKPIMRSIVAEHQAGWASTLEEHFVYILPQKNNQVLSSICPHEGCNVAWRGDTNQFFCPCHDSYFNLDGERASGPSRRGLDPLPTREKDGKLQVKYQSYVNNTEERIVRE